MEICQYLRLKSSERIKGCRKAMAKQPMISFFMPVIQLPTAFFGCFTFQAILQLDILDLHLMQQHVVRSL